MNRMIQWLMLGLVTLAAACGPSEPASSPATQRRAAADQHRGIETDPDFFGYWSIDGKPVPITHARRSMATLTARPNSDAANPATPGGVAWVQNAGGNLWSRVDDVATQPTLPDTSDFISGSYVGVDDVTTDCRLGLDTSALAAGDTITAVTVWIYSANSAAGTAPGTYAELYASGAPMAGGTYFAGTSAGWHSVVYTGLSLAGNTPLSIYLQSAGDPVAFPSPLDNTATVYAAYADITYTPAALPLDAGTVTLDHVTGTTGVTLISATLAASGGTGPYTYSTNWGDGSAASTGSTPSHTYTAAGVYTVTVTATDSLGATDTSTATVTITDPAPPTARPQVVGPVRIF